MRRSNNRIDLKFDIRYDYCDELLENIRVLIYYYHIFDLIEISSSKHLVGQWDREIRDAEDNLHRGVVPVRRVRRKIRRRRGPIHRGHRGHRSIHGCGGERFKGKPLEEAVGRRKLRLRR